MPEPDADDIRNRRLRVLAGVVALAAVVGVLLVVLTGGDDGAKSAGGGLAGQAETAELLRGIPQDGRFLGSPDAPVTLVEFADVQCPFCAEFSREALPTIIRDHVRTGEVRLEFRARAFLGPDSITGAQAVIAAGAQGKLWDVLELLFANQGAENSGWVTRDLVRSAQRAAGVDPLQAQRVANAASTERELLEAERLAARNGLGGTPAFLVGRTGGELEPLQVEELTGAFFSRALDEAVAGS